MSWTGAPRISSRRTRFISCCCMAAFLSSELSCLRPCGRTRCRARVLLLLGAVLLVLHLRLGPRDPLVEIAAILVPVLLPLRVCAFEHLTRDVAADSPERNR